MLHVYDSNQTSRSLFLRVNFSLWKILKHSSDFWLPHTKNENFIFMLTIAFIYFHRHDFFPRGIHKHLSYIVRYFCMIQRESLTGNKEFSTLISFDLFLFVSRWQNANFWKPYRGNLNAFTPSSIVCTEFSFFLCWITLVWLRLHFISIARRRKVLQLLKNAIIFLGTRREITVCVENCYLFLKRKRSALVWYF